MLDRTQPLNGSDQLFCQRSILIMRNFKTIRLISSRLFDKIVSIFQSWKRRELLAFSFSAFESNVQCLPCRFSIAPFESARFSFFSFTFLSFPFLVEEFFFYEKFYNYRSTIYWLLTELSRIGFLDKVVWLVGKIISIFLLLSAAMRSNMHQSLSSN